MIQWLDDFYGSDDMRDTLLRSFGPIFAAYALEVWIAEGGIGAPSAPFVAGLVAAYTDHHLGSSRAQLQELLKQTDEAGALDALRNRFDEWEEKRPAKVAANETIRTGNAIAVERMRESGVEKMTWWASPGACPFCNEIDGVIISVNGTFFNAGDTLNPEGVSAPINFESSIGHPPIHRGCACAVEAVTTE